MISIGSTPDEWSKFAPSFMKLATDGPGIPPAQDMTKAGHIAYPFTSALTILDLGCGPGQISNEVLKAHGSELPETARLVASDLSPGMIEQVRSRKDDEIGKGNTAWDKIETLVCDAQDLSAFPENSVSHVLAGFVLFLVAQPRTALKEIKRILTHSNGGGVLAVSSWQGSEWQDLMSFPSKVRPDKAMPKMPPTWSTIEGVRSELEAGGFREIDVHVVESFMPFEDHDEIARFILFKFPAMARMTADMTQEELRKVLQLMTEHLKQAHPTTPARLTGTAIVGVCRK